VQALDKQFSKHWADYTDTQIAAARQAPLPRKFVVSMQSATRSIVYIDTQSGLEHSVHPNLASLKPLLEQQLVAGRERLQLAKQEAQHQSAAHLGALAEMQHHLLQGVGRCMSRHLETMLFAEAL
jgi:hypothetical protein